MAENSDVDQTLGTAELEQIIANADLDDNAKERLRKAIGFRLIAKQIFGDIPVTLDTTEALVARVRGRTLTPEEIRAERILIYDHLYLIAEKGQTLFCAPRDYEPTDPNLGRIILPFDYDRAGGTE